ncbi:unnamed protein product [Discula destructiva]
MAVSSDHDHHTGSIHVLPDDIETITLGSLLANPLLLCHIVDYLPISALLSLAATSNQFRNLLYKTPRVFRRLDLTTVKSAQLHIEPIDQGGQIWRNAQLDENVTEDDFYAGPLRGIFSALRRRDLLHDVTTLILDGLSVTAELVHDIISDPSFSVRILSLREVRNLNEPKLRAALQMAVRPSRPDGTPRLQGLYIFGARDPPPIPATSAVSKPGTPGSGTATPADWNKRSLQTLVAALNEVADDCAWYDTKGTILSRPVPAEWAETMLACAGVISFDAPLCRGPRHLNSPVYGSINIAANSPPPPYVPSNWSVATIALDGCAGCGSSPEGWTVWGESGGIDGSDDTCRFPLLSPIPLHSSNVKEARCPSGAAVYSRASRAENDGSRRFIARCMECLHGRFCWACNKWWCEKCFTLGQVDPVDGLYYKCRVNRSCWECNVNCLQCIEKTQRLCMSCRGGYCTIHNPGCDTSKNTCDWCSTRRRTRDLYY